MTPIKTLDLKGNFRTYPFAELIVEISQAKLSGSLRLACGEKKTVVYFRDGALVYGVSNAKALRLFTILLSRSIIEQKELANHPNFANDLELAASLQAKGTLTREAIEAANIDQIEAVMIDALSWPGGDWIFSPLARLRDDLVHEIKDFRVLADYARCVPLSVISQRFRSVQESFVVVPGREESLPLQTHEAFVRSRFGSSPMTIEELRLICGMPESGLLQALYVLWLGGVLVRRDWNAALSAAKIGEIRRAKMSLVRGAAKLELPQSETSEPPDSPPIQPIEQAPPDPGIDLPLDDYLDRVEKAETLYDVLSVGDQATVAEIKTRYFEMAKLFHPDRFHRESAVLLRRIQIAFTEIAHAYETLKNPDSRKTYDFKVRKEIEARAKRRAAGQPETAATAGGSEVAMESFELGMSNLADGDFAAAAGFLARAVHYNPQNALYHAYYGKALSADEKKRHKAESEMQSAVRLDPKNAKIRIMLAEFFIDMNMIKRAEGELKRFLEIAPDNKEAVNLLNSIRL